MTSSAILYAKLIAALCKDGGHYEGLSLYSGLHEHTVGRYCRALREAGHAHIEHWEKSANHKWRPHWMFCTERTPDAKKPVQTPAQRLRSLALSKRAAKERKNAVSSVFSLTPPRYSARPRKYK